jgi:spore maturation protein CgeB/glycosyltransferase involved in cell wall biosynthesis
LVEAGRALPQQGSAGRPAVVLPPWAATLRPIININDTGCARPAGFAGVPEPLQLRRLKLACVMDEFSFVAFREECRLQQLTPEHWQSELQAFQPDLLFIESAWRGKDELWGNRVSHASQEIKAIVEWCRSRSIPAAFWNKEDPVHFDTFLTTATLFDAVFTTDIDCIHRYKAALGHDRVYLLPFACQPNLSNPIECYPRKDAFSFAGAYYVRYPERTKDLREFMDHLPTLAPVEIYDRNYGKTDPNYQFPPKYQPYIVGTLPFDQIDKAYKGYRYAINLNSIKQSQSMFARRLFDLLASGTIVVSNFSRSVRLLFGDLVIATDSGMEAVNQLRKATGDERYCRKFRLAGLRKVLQEHTYAHRLAYVISKVIGAVPEAGLPRIAVLARAESQAGLERILDHCRRQTFPDCAFHVVLGEGVAAGSAAHDRRVRLHTETQAKAARIGNLDDKAVLLCGMTAEDYYGPNYLLDIVLASRYSAAQCIGKVAHYSVDADAIRLQHGDAAHRPANRLAARSAAAPIARFADMAPAAWLDALPTLELETEHGLAIDEFNYCRDAACHSDPHAVSRCVDDIPDLDIGLPIARLLEQAERIEPEPVADIRVAVLSGKQLSRFFGSAPPKAISFSIENDRWRVDSTLADGKHDYLYATETCTLAELGATDRFRFYFDASPGLNIQLVVFFLDAEKRKIAHVIRQPNRNEEVEVPRETACIRLGLRVYGSGSADIGEIVLGHRNLQPPMVITQAGTLVVTNHYPSYDDLYRNAFVHSRVLAYARRGTKCDVFNFRPQETTQFREYEKVDVMSGPPQTLHKLLSSGQYENVLVHFLDAAMWEVLRQHAAHINIVVWVHGAEIQPWHRREFNHQTEQQIAAAKVQSARREAFWRGLLNPFPDNLKLVFVSHHFAEEAMADLGFRLPPHGYTVIHNPINTDLFGYDEKPTEQRKRLLSIRPYASRVYGNDLTVATIQLLARERWFEELEFRLIGDGPLFEETLAPLRTYRNVHIEKRFLRQSEIAMLHREYGIFLCPSRMDTQGVSRDEAMSSGLVPVTNAVAAIPEFADEECAILAPAEDAQAMATGIARLYNDPERFAAMSKAAAQRVRTQSRIAKTIAQEMELMR